MEPAQRASGREGEAVKSHETIGRHGGAQSKSNRPLARVSVSGPRVKTGDRQEVLRWGRRGVFGVTFFKSREHREGRRVQRQTARKTPKQTPSKSTNSNRISINNKEPQTYQVSIVPAGSAAMREALYLYTRGSTLSNGAWSKRTCLDHVWVTIGSRLDANRERLA